MREPSTRDLLIQVAPWAPRVVGRRGQPGPAAVHRVHRLHESPVEAWYYPRYHSRVPSVEKIVAAMRVNPRNVRYDDLAKVCEHYFGPPRTPWHGDPRVNIQNDHGRAKAYQVRQVVAAIEKQEGDS
jgi:hypothetical protein